MAVILRLFLSRLWDHGKHLVGPGYPFKDTYDHVARPIFTVILKNILRYAIHRDTTLKVATILVAMAPKILMLAT